MTNKPNLYIGISSVLVDNNFPVENPKLVPCALDFLNWAQERYNCYYLTTWPCTMIKECLPELPDFPRVEWENGDSGQKYGKMLKTDGIDFSNDFIWLESNPDKHDVQVLEDKGLRDKLFIVNPNYDDWLKEFAVQREFDEKAEGDCDVY